MDILHRVALYVFIFVFLCVLFVFIPGTYYSQMPYLFLIPFVAPVIVAIFMEYFSGEKYSTSNESEDHDISLGINNKPMIGEEEWGDYYRNEWLMKMEERKLKEIQENFENIFKPKD